MKEHPVPHWSLPMVGNPANPVNLGSVSPQCRLGSRRDPVLLLQTSPAAFPTVTAT